MPFITKCVRSKTSGQFRQMATLVCVLNRYHRHFVCLSFEGSYLISQFFPLDYVVSKYTHHLAREGASSFTLLVFIVIKLHQTVNSVGSRFKANNNFKHHFILRSHLTICLINVWSGSEQSLNKKHYHKYWNLSLESANQSANILKENCHR